MRIERLATDVINQWIRVGLVQLNLKPHLSSPPQDFGWHLDDSDKPIIKQKIFSALDLARSNSANIVCFPELCFSREWVEQVKSDYADMIVIGGSYYHEGYNISNLGVEVNATFC